MAGAAGSRHGIIGPVDEAPSRMGAVLLALWRRRLPALTGGGFDWVDVRDVVTALTAAADRGRRGECCLVPGHRVSIPALAGLAAAGQCRVTAGRRRPGRRGPSRPRRRCWPG
jgi:nucleoside-diphosphate-sugar epimerase